MSTLVFVPTTPDLAAGLWQGRSLHGVQAFTVTPRLLETLDLGPKDAEDAEYACLVLASVWGLAQHGVRLVLVGQVEDAAVAAGDEADNGGVLLQGLAKRQVESWFTDGREAPRLPAAVQAARGLSLDEAWEADAVQQLVREGDLLWHAVTELAHLGEDV